MEFQETRHHGEIFHTCNRNTCIHKVLVRKPVCKGILKTQTKKCRY